MFLRGRPFSRFSRKGRGMRGNTWNDVLEMTGEIKTPTGKDHGPLVQIQGIVWKFGVGEAFLYRNVLQVVERLVATVDVVDQASKCEHLRSNRLLFERKVFNSSWWNTEPNRVDILMLFCGRGGIGGYFGGAVYIQYDLTSTNCFQTAATRLQVFHNMLDPLLANIRRSVGEIVRVDGYGFTVLCIHHNPVRYLGWGHIGIDVVNWRWFLGPDEIVKLSKRRLGMSEFLKVPASFISDDDFNIRTRLRSTLHGCLSQVAGA